MTKSFFEISVKYEDIELIANNKRSFFPLAADVKTDARAKMSVAAKMSLFKVSLCLSRH